MGPAMWLDADDAFSVTATAGAVSEWRDQTIWGRDATQATAGAQRGIAGCRRPSTSCFAAAMATAVSRSGAAGEAASVSSMPRAIRSGATAAVGSTRRQAPSSQTSVQAWALAWRTIQ